MGVARSKFNCLQAIVIAGLLILTPSCGRPKQQVDIREGSSIASDTLSVTDPNCKRSACPAVQFSLVDDSGTDATTVTFNGSIRVKVAWNFKVKSEATPGRIRIALAEKPSWLVSEPGKDPGSLVAIGEPLETASDAAFAILARDISRCKALEKVTKDCADTKVSFKEYDKLFNIKFSIK